MSKRFWPATSSIARFLGPFTDARPTSFAETRVNIEVNGTALHADIDPAAQLGQLEDILSGVARQLPLAGAGLDAGDILITGWVVTPLKVTGGETIRVSLADGSNVDRAEGDLVSWSVAAEIQ